MYLRIGNENSNILLFLDACETHINNSFFTKSPINRYAFLSVKINLINILYANFCVSVNCNATWEGLLELTPLP